MAKINKAPSIDHDWQAENDARSLMDAACIKKDPKRLNAAIAYAKNKIQQYKGCVIDSMDMDADKDMD